MVALVDDSPGVRSLAEFLLADTLASKAPLLAYNHFVEALFLLNDCHEGVGGGGDPGAAMMEAGGEAFHLRGAAPAMRAKRDAIYRWPFPCHHWGSSVLALDGVVAGL